MQQNVIKSTCSKLDYLTLCSIILNSFPVGEGWGEGISPQPARCFQRAAVKPNQILQQISRDPLITRRQRAAQQQLRYQLAVSPKPIAFRLEDRHVQRQFIHRQAFF